MELNQLKLIETRDTTILLRADGILETRVKITDNLRHDLDDAKAVMLAVMEVSDGQLRPLLSALGDIYVTTEAQKFYKNHPKAALASAMVVKSFVQRMMGNFFLNYSQLPIPTKLFENEEKAIQWLKTFL